MHNSDILFYSILPNFIIIKLPVAVALCSALLEKINKKSTNRGDLIISPGLLVIPPRIDAADSEAIATKSPLN